MVASPAGLAWLLSEGDWVPARHLVYLNEKLLQLANRDIRRLLVLMPPRHGKSNFVSEWFPVWYLGTFPDHRVVFASYEADFAAEWGAKVRDHLAEHGPEVFDLQVSELSHARLRFDLVGHAGGMRTAGVGGPITGVR